jgi:hypothetical protein
MSLHRITTLYLRFSCDPASRPKRLLAGARLCSRNQEDQAEENHAAQAEAE